MREKLLKALKCCREGDCTSCPMIGEICEDLILELEEIPTELLDKIQEWLSRKSGT